MLCSDLLNFDQLRNLRYRLSFSMFVGGGGEGGGGVGTVRVSSYMEVGTVGGRGGGGAERCGLVPIWRLVQTCVRNDPNFQAWEYIYPQIIWERCVCVGGGGAGGTDLGIYLSSNNLIFFIFIRFSCDFPAILLVKTIDSYLHEFCTGYFT